jgi:hypothetical protein
MRRAVIGFTLRLIIAAAVSLLVWWLSTTPFDHLPLPPSIIFIAVRLLNFPVALAGELFPPIRGIQLLFEGYGTWCDFCPADELFRQQMSIAIPTYLVLLYLPAVLRSIARRRPRLFKRIVIGLFLYAAFTTAYFLVTAGGDREGDVQIAAMWLLILSAAAACAWSKLELRWKVTAVVAVLLAGAWACSFMMTFIALKMDAVRSYFVPYLVLLIFGVGGTLWLTWAVENGIEWWQRRDREFLGRPEGVE